nr:hypothetical protein [Desulfobacula sp.]
MKKCVPLFLFLMGIFSLSPAQESPDISLTLIFMPEKYACNPDGYADYVKGETSGCVPLTINQVEKWKRAYGFIETEFPSPDSNLSLGNRLFGLLDAYRTAPITTADDRKSIVVIFDWKSARTTEVRLTRKIMNPSGQSPFPEMSWEGRLQEERRWIHHERADAFLPIHRVTWILESGGRTWEFGTAP